MGASLPPELARLLSASDQRTREPAWDAFLTSYGRLLLHTARSVTNDHDAAMDAYARVLEALRADDFHRLRAFTPMPGTRFTTWLVMVVRRLCVDQVRARYGQPRGTGTDGAQLRLVRRRLADLVTEELDPDRLGQPADSGPETELRSRELKQVLDATVAALSPADRLLLALRFDDGRSAREIADAMRLPTPFHVYRRLHAVLGTLRRALEQRGVDGPEP